MEAIRDRVGELTGLLLDVDRDTPKLAKKAKQSVEDLVRDHKFDAEFAQVLFRVKPR